ncbi:hypothetical protein ABVT39_023032 [Epinephelus coioides]
MDTREVSVCSTLHTAFAGETIKRATKVGGRHTAVQVKDYNSFMGGVDLSDQLIGSYSSGRKRKKWYLTVLHHFIDIAVTNSYLLHKELCGRLEQQPMTHQAFQEQLTGNLCGVPSRVPESYQHIPVAIVEGVSGSKKAIEARKVPLCVTVDRNCHKIFHSSPGASEK